MLKCLANTKLGKSAIAAVAALSLYGSEAKADENLEARTAQEFDQAIGPADVIAEFLISLPAQLMIHELGHYSIGMMLGYHPTIYGPRSKMNGGAALASTQYSDEEFESMSNGEIAVISAGGLISTTLGSLAITNYLINTDNENSLRPFLAALSLTMMFDRYYYFSTSAFWHYHPTMDPAPGDDISLTINSSGINDEVAYALISAETLAEIALRWGEIRYLWQTAIGNNPEYKPTGIVFSLVPNGETVNLEASGRF